MDKIEKLVDIFKALSDPTRLRMVKLLNECQTGVCNGGPLCVNALAHQLGVTQSAVSQHLRILRQAGLVRGAGMAPLCNARLIPMDLRSTGPHFMTKKQRIANLENFLADLRDEAKAVEEHIARIKKEKQITILKREEPSLLSNSFV